jgi:hypothetical protein
MSSTVFELLFVVRIAFAEFLINIELSPAWTGVMRGRSRVVGVKLILDIIHDEQRTEEDRAERDKIKEHGLHPCLA